MVKSPMLMGKWWVLSCKDFLSRHNTDILNQHAYGKSPCLNQESYVASQSLSVSTAVVQQSVDISNSRCVGTFWSAARRCGIRVHFCGHIEQWLHTTETKVGMVECFITSYAFKWCFCPKLFPTYCNHLHGHSAASHCYLMISPAISLELQLIPYRLGTIFFAKHVFFLNMTPTKKYTYYTSQWHSNPAPMNSQLEHFSQPSTLQFDHLGPTAVVGFCWLGPGGVAWKLQHVRRLCISETLLRGRSNTMILKKYIYIYIIMNIQNKLFIYMYTYTLHVL